MPCDASVVVFDFACMRMASVRQKKMRRTIDINIKINNSEESDVGKDAPGKRKREDAAPSPNKNSKLKKK